MAHKQLLFRAEARAVRSDNAKAALCHTISAKGAERCRIVSHLSGCNLPRGGPACATFVSCGESCGV